MSNPCRAPRENIKISSVPTLPDANCSFVWREPEGGADKNAFRSRQDEVKNLDVLTREVEASGVDWIIAEPFTLPPELVRDPECFKKKHGFRASTNTGNMSFRSRSEAAFTLANGLLPYTPPFMMDAILEKSRKIVMADGGAQNTLGRLLHALPKKGDKVAFPITAEEARDGWREEIGPEMADAYVYAAPDEYGPLPFTPESEGGEAVKVNMKAGNAFPVKAKGDTPGAKEVWYSLAVQVRKELVEAYERDPVHGVRLWVRKAERERPYLVALEGKCKGDYYTLEKIEEFFLRFYNAMGRQMALNIQIATQVLESHSRSLIDDVANRSASGVALNGGGAAKIVDALDAQIKVTHGKGHARMGDDSWVAYVYTHSGLEKLVQFALDCSNFDLTQHADLTPHVHWELRRILSVIDPVAAQLLHTYQRERLVVVLSTMVRKMRHAGVSGLGLQSKVNGVIMGTAINRALSKLDDLTRDGTSELTEEVVAQVLAEVGRGMRIAIKLEQYTVTELTTTSAEDRPVRHALKERTFLFLGYHFYNENGEVSVYADLPRSIAQLRYPGLKWVKGKLDWEAKEAVRLASIIMGWGKPTDALVPMFTQALTKVIGLLDRAIRNSGDLEDPSLRWAIQLSAQAEVIPGADALSLKGLKSAAQRMLTSGWEPWAQAADPLATPVGSFEDLIYVPGDLAPANIDAGRIAPPSRRPTIKTDGRNPNTKVFGPPQQAQARVDRRHENAAFSGQARRAQDWADEQTAYEEYAQGLVARRETPDDDGGDFYADDDGTDQVQIMEADRFYDNGGEWDDAYV